MEAFIIIPTVLALIGWGLYKLDQLLLPWQQRQAHKRGVASAKTQIQRGAKDAQIVKDAYEQLIKEQQETERQRLLELEKNRLRAQRRS